MPTLCADLCSHLCSHLCSRSQVTLLDSEDSDGLERPELHGKSGEVDGWDARAQASIGLPLSSRVSVVSHLCPHLSPHLSVRSLLCCTPEGRHPARA